MDEQEYEDLCAFLCASDNSSRWPTSVKSKNEKRNFRQKCGRYLLLRGTLHYNHSKHGHVRVIKTSETKDILKACHTDPSAGHFGINKTSEKITSRYFWPSQHKDIRDYISFCDKCQRINHLRKTPAELHPIPPPDDSFTQFGMDLVGPFPETSSGNKYIVVLTDYLTKWPEAEAIPCKEANVIAKFIMKVVCRYSSVNVLITDQGREFCNKVNSELCNRLGIDHRRTTAYHPQANGLTERFNQTLVNSIVKYVNENQDDWDCFIDPVLLAYRTSSQTSTKHTPFFLAFGKKPKLFIKDKYSVGEMQECSLDFQTAIDNRIRNVASLFKHQHEAKSNTEAAQVKQKQYFDKLHEPSYNIGDQVLVNNSRRINRKGDKLAPRWVGPYAVESVMEKGLLKLKGRKTLTNVLRVKPYNDSSVDATNPRKRQKTRNTDFNHVIETDGQSLNTDGQSRNTDGQSPQTDNDCEIINTETVETFMFNSIDKEWQQDRAQILGLKVRKYHDGVKAHECSVVAPPANKATIRPDGNCYFRTLSHLITGCQSGHKVLRKLVTDYTAENDAKISSVTSSESYASNSSMHQTGEWATEVEIFATANFLATDIYVFSPYNRDQAGNWTYKWLKYAALPVVQPLSSLVKSQNNMYISNVSHHFEPVYNI